MRKLLLVSVMLWATPVFAADMPLKAPGAIDRAVHDTWAGFYLGIDAAYGWANYKPEIPGVVIPAPFNEFKAKGWGFGGNAGYNWQLASFVFGFEIDYFAANIDVTNSIPKGPSITASVDSFGSARARLGYALMPGFLFYATGGLGLLNATASAVSGNTNFVADSHTWSWVAGVGGELKITQNISAKLEYLHFDGGHANFAFGAPVSQNVRAAGNLDVVKAGLNYRF